jgi:predicted metal-dependent peptidase
MLDEPYLASAIAQFPLINAEGLEWCKTMAVDGYYIYVNPEFCKTLDKDETIFVLAHEVMHCILGHIDRRGSRDKEIWNWASDYATNLKLKEFGFKMPKAGLIDEKYKGLTSEEVYEDLLKNKENLKGNQWDIHLDPNDPRGQKQRAKEFPSPEERKRLRVSLVNEIKKHGTKAGDIEYELKMAKGEDIPWDILLSKFFTGLRRDNYRLMPPNKKHIWRGLYLPSIGTPGPQHIVVAIDTSGSMDDQTLKEILGIIDNLRSSTQCKLTLIQCDAKIQKIEEFEEFSPTNFQRYKVLGGGGTSFTPVFTWIKKRGVEENYHFDTLIYLSDGYGEFPKSPPDFPILWVITENGNKVIPFGEVIRLGK